VCHREKIYKKPERQQWRRDHRQSVQDWVDEQKKVPCTDCEIEYPPYVMDFDHVRPGKTKNVTKMIGRNSKELIAAEIALCEVVCSNCHRERTYQRRLTAKAQ
jgi:hypothetical protein